MKFERLVVALGCATLAGGCGGEEIKWTEDVQLHDGKVVHVERRTELSGGGFPVSKRGFQTYHELCYAPLGVYWKSKPEYRPEIFELDGGKAYVKVTLGSFNTCGRHGYPKDDSMYFVWSGGDWKSIGAADFPRGGRLNLLQNPMGNTRDGDARGTVAQEEKEQRDAGLYYTLRTLRVSRLNEAPPYKGVCTEHTVEKPAAPLPASSIFLASQRKTCD